MSLRIREMLLKLALLPLSLAVLVAAGCSSSMTSTATQSSASMGPAFLVGTDAPMASVVSFQVQIDSVELTGSGGNTGNLVTGTPTVDFARFNGLQTLVDMNDVQNGTYTGVTITLGSASLSYLDTANSPPTITTLTSSTTPALKLSQSTLNITLNKPLMIQHGTQPVGLRMDFDLAQSIAVDSNGNITGVVNPTIDLRTIARTDTWAHIDYLVGGVVTLPSSGGTSFVIQGPHGEPFTVDTSASTHWGDSASLSTLNTKDIVQVSGQLDPADQTLDADEVAILSDSNFYASGQITYVTPATGAASSFDLYTRALEPSGIDPSVISLGQIAQVNLTGSEKYYIYSMDNPFTQFVFNANSLVAGQDVAIGGPDSGITSAGVTVHRIHLRNWGFNGTIVAGSQNSSSGSFQMQVNGFAGVLIPSPVTVYLGGLCDFRYGLGAFSDLSDGAKIRVVGLLLKNPTSGQVILWARHVDGLNFTDASTFAF
jgi:Domain of unknown function (DUF4382)